MGKINFNQNTMAYGIIKGQDIDFNNLRQKNIDYKIDKWAQMRDYNDFAKNHCGATFIVNLAIFFESQGYKNLLINDSIDQTFKFVHEKIGNGPIVFVAPKARWYFSTRGYKLKYRFIDSFKLAKEAIDRGKPLGILLAQSPISWHWVLGLGYLENKKLQFFRVINAWENTDNRYYLVNNKARFFSAKEYYIEN